MAEWTIPSLFPEPIKMKISVQREGSTLTIQSNEYNVGDADATAKTLESLLMAAQIVMGKHLKEKPTLDPEQTILVFLADFRKNLYADCVPKKQTEEPPML